MNLRTLLLQAVQANEEPSIGHMIHCRCFATDLADEQGKELTLIGVYQVQIQLAVPEEDCHVGVVCHRVFGPSIVPALQFTES